MITSTGIVEIKGMRTTLARISLKIHRKTENVPWMIKLYSIAT